MVGYGYYASILFYSMDIMFYGLYVLLFYRYYVSILFFYSMNVMLLNDDVY